MTPTVKLCDFSGFRSGLPVSCGSQEPDRCACRRCHRCSSVGEVARRVLRERLEAARRSRSVKPDYAAAGSANEEPGNPLTMCRERHCPDRRKLDPALGEKVTEAGQIMVIPTRQVDSSCFTMGAESSKKSGFQHHARPFAIRLVHADQVAVRVLVGVVEHFVAERRPDADLQRTAESSGALTAIQRPEYHTSDCESTYRRSAITRSRIASGCSAKRV